MSRFDKNINKLKMCDNKWSYKIVYGYLLPNIIINKVDVFKTSMKHRTITGICGTLILFYLDLLLVYLIFSFSVLMCN